MAELPRAPQYPTQGATVFVDLERRDLRRGYTPLNVVRALLGGRGVNMFYLHRLLDETRQPLDPDVPLIFGSGVLTGIVPSAARGNATSWSPCARVFPTTSPAPGRATSRWSTSRGPARISR
jgi:aldehyde:ferredoxin oxidoreductase